MNVSTSLLAQPLAPERWIVCSDGAGRGAKIKAELGKSNELYIVWRLRHDLVRFVAPGELDTALCEALDGHAPQVHVFHDLSSGVIHQWLGAPPDRERRRRLRIRRLTGLSVAPIVRELSRPDGLVEAGWLFDGRQSPPPLDSTGQNQSFIDDEARAFKAWSTAFVGLHGEAELDAIFSDTGEAGELADAQEPTDGPSVGAQVLPFTSVSTTNTSPTAPRAPSFAPGSRDWSDLEYDDALPLAASSAPEAVNDVSTAPHPDATAPRGEPIMVLELRSERGSWRAPPDPDGRIEVYSQAEPGNPSRRCLTVDVSLWGTRWAGRDELVLALVPHTHRPLLLRLGAKHLPNDTAWSGSTLGEVQRRGVTLRHTVDQSVADALRGGVIELHDFTDDGAAVPAAQADGPPVV